MQTLLVFWRAHLVNLNEIGSWYKPLVGVTARVPFEHADHVTRHIYKRAFIHVMHHTKKELLFMQHATSKKSCSSTSRGSK
jgi:hypothetical protein